MSEGEEKRKTDSVFQNRSSSRSFRVRSGLSHSLAGAIGTAARFSVADLWEAGYANGGMRLTTGSFLLQRVDGFLHKCKT